MSYARISILIILLSHLFCTQSLANQKWYVKPTLGLSYIEDIDATTAELLRTFGDTDIDLDIGYAAGFGIGYFINPNLVVELAWEYRSNESSTVIANQAAYPDGNYATNLFFANAYFVSQGSKRLKPYIGFGMAVSQEVDIDLENSDTSLSYSSSGDIGFQVMGGFNFLVMKRLWLQAELRYTQLADIELDGEGDAAAGLITDIDYTAVTAQIAAVYRF
ncbi:outer membrane protein [Thalassotalea agarivorans]|uniref:Outer membrane protein W n=1 Tax=Thalassotalea agarivorans TaxID=349064 RepID=A0A1I0CDF1_THASX|nr:OmpW family outer membrane protein [Thalassotalea agarivorans]SET17454.1 Outer membrane protein W [Thalassotalea agarivorans]